MTQDEIIEMARHIADTFGTRMCDENNDTHGEELYAMGIDDIVDSIKLVAAKAFPDGVDAEWIARRTKYAVEQEREACAKECEHTALRMGSEWMAAHCAEAIRARGEA
jgi:adenosylmethionine-8-amino-7-oxononanoate aminotransferase